MNPVMSRLQFPRLKLALTYLAIIMGMSLVFSIAIYNISDSELKGQRNMQVPRELRVNFLADFERLRELRLEEARNNLRERLVIFNLFTLTIGAMLSYFLAIRALKPIEEAMEAQDRFTSDASHEIRTPLTVMRSEIEVALRDNNLTMSEAKDTLHSNLEEIVKLEALTTGLLQLARQENIDLVSTKTSVKELVQSATLQIKPKAQEKSVKINTKNITDFSVFCQPESMEQALVILLDNAIKYSPEKSTIAVSTKNGRINHSISVSDNGAGIHPDDLPHIFERFYRADASRSKSISSNGYGLGLAIAKQIVESHGGHIAVSSKPTSGTTFTIQLPKK